MIATHVLPYRDDIEHEKDGSCPCGPKRVDFDTPTPSVMYRHHPLKTGMVAYFCEEVTE